MGCYYRFQGISLVECPTFVRGVGDWGFIIVSLDRIWVVLDCDKLLVSAYTFSLIYKKCFNCSNTM